MGSGVNGRTGMIGASLANEHDASTAKRKAYTSMTDPKMKRRPNENRYHCVIESLMFLRDMDISLRKHTKSRWECRTSSDIGAFHFSFKKERKPKFDLSNASMWRPLSAGCISCVPDSIDVQRDNRCWYVTQNPCWSKWNLFVFFHIVTNLFVVVVGKLIVQDGYGEREK